MVGVNTELADDPMLTVRDVSGRNPIRCVVDSKLRIRLDSHLVTTAKEVSTCVITTQDASEVVAETLANAGVSVIRVSSTAEGRVDITAALKALAAREVVSVLCEGGAELAITYLNDKAKPHVEKADRLSSGFQKILGPFIARSRNR